jgi:hypothetical protein
MKLFVQICRKTLQIGTCNVKSPLDFPLTSQGGAGGIDFISAEFMKLFVQICRKTLQIDTHNVKSPLDFSLASQEGRRYRFHLC